MPRLGTGGSLGITEYRSDKINNLSKSIPSCLKMILKRVSLSCICRLDTEHGVGNKGGTMKFVLHGEETIDEGNNNVTATK